MSDWVDAERHIERAHELYEAGRWDEAESELRAALSINPHRAEWHFNLGLTLEAAGKFDAAMGAFRDAHALDPEDPQAALAMGVNCLRVGRVRESVDWFESAQRLDATDPDTYIHRIEAYGRLGEHDQAETMFFLARQYDQTPTQEASGYANLAESLMTRTLFDRAIWCLREASHLDPSLPRVHARLAAAHAATGRHDRARQLYLRELREHPGCIETLLDLGCLLLDMNRLAEAGEKFRRILEIESDHPEAHFHLAELAARQGRDREAIATLRVVLRLDPEHPEARRRLAELYLGAGETEPALELLRAEHTRFKHEKREFDDEDLLDLGGLLLDAGAPLEAISVFELLVEHRPQDARAWHELSVALLRSGDIDRGLDACREAIRRDETLPAALHNMALAHLHLGQRRRAWWWLRRALELDPEDGSLRRMRLILRARETVGALHRAWSAAARGGRRFSDAVQRTRI